MHRRISNMKKLGKSVLEAGRTPRSKYARKKWRKKERRENRKFCYDSLNVEDFEDLTVEPKVNRRCWDFDQGDKLGCAYRWLDSQVGKPWDKVFSTLSELFGKGIALSHVVDIHILSSVDIKPDPVYEEYVDTLWYKRNHPYYVCPKGFLRKRK